MLFLDIEHIVKVSIVSISDLIYKCSLQEVISSHGCLFRERPVRHIIWLTHGSILIIVATSRIVTIERKTWSDINLHVTADSQILIFSRADAFICNISISMTEIKTFTGSCAFTCISTVSLFTTI